MFVNSLGKRYVLLYQSIWSNSTNCQIHFSKIAGPISSFDQKQQSFTHVNNRQNHILRWIMKRFLAFVYLMMLSMLKYDYPKWHSFCNQQPLNIRSLLYQSLAHKIIHVRSRWSVSTWHHSTICSLCSQSSSESYLKKDSDIVEAKSSLLP